MGRHSGGASASADAREEQALFDVVRAGVLDALGPGALWTAAFPPPRGDAPLFDDLIARVVAMRVIEGLGTSSRGRRIAEEPEAATVPIRIVPPDGSPLLAIA